MVNNGQEQGYLGDLSNAGGSAGAWGAALAYSPSGQHAEGTAPLSTAAFGPAGNLQECGSCLLLARQYLQQVSVSFTVGDDNGESQTANMRLLST